MASVAENESINHLPPSDIPDDFVLGFGGQPRHSDNDEVTRSSAPYSVNDLYAVAGGEAVLAESAAGDQLLVDLDGQPLAAQLQLVYETGHIGAVGDLGGTSVDEDLHVRLLLWWFFNSGAESYH